MARFSDKLQPATRTMDTEVDVPNPKLVLVPGMYAEVNLTLKAASDALLCTRVGSRSGHCFILGRSSSPTSGTVMVVAPDNRLRRSRVNIGLETANRIEFDPDFRMEKWS